MKKRVFVILIALALFITASCVTVFALDSETGKNDDTFAGTNFESNAQVEGSISVDEKYVFYFEAPEREYPQLTEEELCAPTDELIDAVLSSPCMLEFTYASTPNTENGTYKRLSESFNGLSELESREDAPSLMLEKLAEYKADESAVKDYYLICLLSEEVFFSRLTADEAELFRELAQR